MLGGADNGEGNHGLMQRLVQGLVQGLVPGLVGVCTHPAKEYAEDANRHAPRLGNPWQTLGEVLEDVHAA